MSVVYGGMHSVMFIRLIDSTAKHSWNDFHLIPSENPVIALPEPKIQLIEIPGRSKRIDLTDYMPGGLTYGPRSGDLSFYVDHNRWNGWKNAYNALSEYFNGEKFAVYLMDNPNCIYKGRVYLSEYSPEDTYSSVTLHYELEPDIVTNGYVHVKFLDSIVYGNTLLQESMVKSGGAPKFYGALPKHPGYVFDDWDPSISEIESDTTYVATYTADVWGDINRRIVDGSYKTYYSIGDAFPLKIGDAYNGEAQIAAIDTDVTDDGGIIPLTFITKDCLNETHKMDSSSSIVSHRYSDTELKQYVDSLESLLPEDLQTIITAASKTSLISVDDSLSEVSDTMRLWIPSEREILGADIIGYERTGPIYSDLYNSNASRIKKIRNSAIGWWLRSIGRSNSRSGVYSSGEFIIPNHGAYDYGVAVGFCIGEPKYTIVFEDYDGTELKSYQAKKGDMPIPPSNPIRSGYDFIGWSPNLSIITGSQTYVALYREDSTEVYYTITFNDYDGTQLKSYQATEGSTPIPPSDPTRSGYIFTGWNPSLAVVTATQTYTATYSEDSTPSTDDDWNTVDARIKNGTYRTYYSVGDTIPLDMGSEYNGYAQIVGIDADVDANGNTIPLSFITVDLLKTKHVMNTIQTSSGGYPASEMKTYIDGLESSLPTKLSSMIVASRKVTKQHEPSNTDLVTSLRLWIPSFREVYGGSNYETSGVTYSSAFPSASSLMKKSKSEAYMSSSIWQLRSSFDDYQFCLVGYNGERTNGSSADAFCIALGFCVGASST